MMNRMLARLIVALHAGYAIFVVVGALLVFRWPAIIWVNLAAVAWAFLTLVFDMGCPLTPWEKTLWRRGGVEPYPEGFVHHHFLRNELTDEQSHRVHVALGALVLILNAGVYSLYFLRR